jgi:dipeptidyl aminopeptidase/acylaminoacyl peptidase
MKNILCLLIVGLFAMQTTNSLASPTIEDYGRKPQIQMMDLSPDGSRVAYVRELNGENVMLVVDVASKKLIGGTRYESLKPRGINFVNNDLVVFIGSETTKLRGTGRKTELFATMSYNVPKDKTVTMLGNNDRLYPGSSGSGIFKVDDKNNRAYMNAREGLYGGNKNPINLYKVDLISGEGKRYKRGNQHTQGWFIGEDFQVKGRVDYHSSKQDYRIYSYLSGKPKMVYSQQAERAIDVAAGALSEDEKSVYFFDDDKVYLVSLADGSKTRVSDIKDDVIVSGIVKEDGKITGIAYTGLRPYIEFLDTERNTKYNSFRSQFPNSRVSFLGGIKDQEKALYVVSGSDMADGYLLHDTAENKITQIASSYPNIKPQNIGEVQTINYKSRDGLTIPALLTWPASAKTKEQRKNLPLIALPHGGPEAHDSLRFDWWAQYLANKGYLVLQPNFRGSSGFGRDFTEAGSGKWGNEMQHDISDGVLTLVKSGYADKERVCIMGASYGGYAAMAGGAFTPELYKCIVAVAGVSDIHKMYNRTRFNAGPGDWIVRHWAKLMGDDSSALKKVSPVNFADQFTSPILIIHGEDDLVVPIDQSKIMHAALKKAGKSTRFVPLKKEDHWLSGSDTRLKMLKEIDSFLDQHNPI